MEKEIKEKKSNGSKVVIVILSLLLLGACAYIAYDKLMVKEDNNLTNEKKESDRLLLWIIGNVITSTNDSDDDITSIRISLSEVKYPTDKFYLKMYINRINIAQYDSKYVSKDKLYDILKIVLDYFEKNGLTAVLSNPAQNNATLNVTLNF